MPWHRVQKCVHAPAKVQQDPSRRSWIRRHSFYKSTEWILNFQKCTKRLDLPRQFLSSPARQEPEEWFHYRNFRLAQWLRCRAPYKSPRNRDDLSETRKDENTNLGMNICQTNLADLFPELPHLHVAGLKSNNRRLGSSLQSELKSAWMPLWIDVTFKRPLITLKSPSLSNRSFAACKQCQ